jgi:Flp pilus assembly protein TadG
MRAPCRCRRRGSILPILALLIVGLCGFVALSVEVATIAMIKVQCQNAADSSALAGARALNGSSNNNVTGSQAIAYVAAEANYTLGTNSAKRITQTNFISSEVTYTPGTYRYNTSSQTFSPAYTLQSGENYNLVKTTVKRQVQNAFFAVDAGQNNPSDTSTIIATAVASHRPRDVAILLDFSGSMNVESDLWNCETYLGSYNNQSNNPDPNIPTFGHYSDTADAAIVSTLGSPLASCNITAPNLGMPAMPDSYFQTTAATTPSVPAFTSAPNSYASNPKGDIPLNTYLLPSYPFVQTVNQIGMTSYTTSFPTTASAGFYANFQSTGYDYAYQKEFLSVGTPTYPSGHTSTITPGFSGYTVGPNYWGKTFFQWPPDPRPTKDWRYLYFTDVNNNPVVSNTTLWNSAGEWNRPIYNGTTNYHVNYKAILNWIKNVGPNPFPPQLIAGNILYYSYIPDDVPASAYNWSQLNSNITDPSVRFWKEYIDYALGNWLDQFGNSIYPGMSSMSYGPDFIWGTPQITAKPTGTAPNGSTLAYMNFNDNPLRPRHRMWFGPMTMLQYISDVGLTPGTARDISAFSAKLGVASVLQNAQINHPNDLIALIPYNRPQYSNEPPIGQFNQALYNLNNNYSAMINSLWYPPNSSSTTLVRPWDTNCGQTVHAALDGIGDTLTQHALMLAYNQFSTSSTLSNLTNAGGTGRVGAKKLVILETDGMANWITTANFTNNAGTNSYYNIQPGTSLTAATYDQNNLLQVVQSICNTTAGVPGTPNSAVANPGNPGFATPSKPVEVQTIAFGIIFEIPTTSQTSAISLLQAISQIGGTSFPSSSTDSTNGYKWCIGTLNQRVSALQNAFSRILNDGNSISLVQ